MLEIRDIDTYYGFSHILQGVSLSVKEGSVVGLLGRNGVGKTTLIRSVIGFTPPKSGQVIFKSVDITHLPSHRIVQMGVALVPQGRRTFKSLSVLENLTAAAMDRGKGWSLERIYSLFPILEERRSQRAGSLSGGEQQMLATARALRNEPDLLLMDEPTEGLAPMMVHDLGNVMGHLRATGIAILFVEQHLAFALEIADQICVMMKGKIVYEGLPKDLESHEEIKTQYLGV